MDRSNTPPSKAFHHHPDDFPALPTISSKKTRASSQRHTAVTLPKPWPRRSATSSPHTTRASRLASTALKTRLPTPGTLLRTPVSKKPLPVSALPVFAVRGKKSPIGIIRVLTRSSSAIPTTPYPAKVTSHPIRDTPLDSSLHEFSVARPLSPQELAPSPKSFSPTLSCSPSLLELDEPEAANVVEELEPVEPEDMANLGSSPGDARRGVISPRPKGRENARNTVCRNIGIYGHCRYQNEGCLYNHETASSKTNLAPTFENRSVIVKHLSTSAAC
jgi:hypothetical protein